jgi:hypothetical protein
MRPLLMLAALFLMGATAVPNVDPGLIGVWTINVPNSQGTARWDVHDDGTYSSMPKDPAMFRRIAESSPALPVTTR